MVYSAQAQLAVGAYRMHMDPAVAILYIGISYAQFWAITRHWAATPLSMKWDPEASALRATLVSESMDFPDMERIMNFSIEELHAYIHIGWYE